MSVSASEHSEHAQPIINASARTRSDNMPTFTVDATFTDAQRLLFDRIDAIKASIDYIKISNGPFIGKRQSAASNSTSSKCITYQKFIINLKSVINRAVKVLPRGIGATAGIDNIFRELSIEEEPPDYVKEYNELIYEILLGVCDEDALQVVLLAQLRGGL